MKQAFQPGFYGNADGTEVEIRSGVIRPDGHRDVQRCPSIFRDVDIEEEPEPVSAAAARPARAANRPAKGAPGGAP